MAMLHKKIVRIQQHLQKNKIDLLIAINLGHQTRDDLLYYCLLQHLELAALVIPKKGKATLYAIPFEVAALKKAFSSLLVRPLDKKLSDILSACIPNKRTVVGYLGDSLPVAVHTLLQQCTAQLAPTQLEQVMAQKFPEEITRLKRAAQIGDHAFTDAIRKLRSCKTERDLARVIDAALFAHHAEPAFPTIVASGAHAADPHHQPSNRTLKKGFCVIDMGARVAGYCSDMTRTLYLGLPTDKEKALYKKILEVQTHAIARVAPGASTREIDAAARMELGTDAKFFVHSLGHGLGTQVHEYPRLSTTGDTTLMPGMYVTIEPGVYKKNAFGIRIEDDVLVTNNGRKVLTQSPKELIVVKR